MSELLHVLVRHICNIRFPIFARHTRPDLIHRRLPKDLSSPTHLRLLLSSLIRLNPSNLLSSVTFIDQSDKPSTY